ncbi:putative non-specific serine/threonine protein kinase [Rosa chinensis]|uniref:Putative non-specific serine/threonine protein kinase n=1 Tax=Rosa chinensis TaxID=74649 RepID=A0A2P6QTM6_ROSCH|nr:LRR receptor-like serine/threonine-protein kinase ER1 [Rosa chinensis]PRQ37533.1 putative non-specific serine/threonine protein kinase [Rosa chinensis]
MKVVAAYLLTVLGGNASLSAKDLEDHSRLRSFNVNNLTGPISVFLGYISTLKYLNLETNMCSGTVPPELGKLVNLQNLNCMREY